MKWSVKHNAYCPKTGQRRGWHCFNEIIEAQGLMHVAKLAQKHADELTKTLKGNNLVRVADIDQVIPKEK